MKRRVFRYKNHLVFVVKLININFICDCLGEIRPYWHIYYYEKNQFEVFKLLWLCCAGL